MRRLQAELGVLPRWILAVSSVLVTAIAPGPSRLAASEQEPRLAELVVDTGQPGEPIDLTRFALGQGGLSDLPMYDQEVDRIARLRPQTIRLFVQEYFNLLPASGKYHWTTLDRSIETILATGARPILSLCFKPKVLYPVVDQDRGHPTDYGQWERLIEALVRHCNQERRYGIEYWEVGNEVDIGEDGGCPYRFRPDDYAEYYARTVGAILRADPQVKVGGPALANCDSPIGDALIAYCAQGKAPLHFFSWHLYSDDPQAFRRTIRRVKQKLAPHPALAATELILDEWNIGLVKAEPAVGFQAAFVLETTRGFLEEGLSRSAYYHIRDFFVDPENFLWMSPSGREFMADWWNVKPQNSGLFDNRGVRRPAYHAFQMLSGVHGRRLPVAGTGGGIQALAAQDGARTCVVLWNFAPVGTTHARDVAVRFTAPPVGSFRVTRLDSAANRLEVIRTGPVAELAQGPWQFELPPYGIAMVQAGTFPVQVSWGHRSPAGGEHYLKVLSGDSRLRLKNVTGCDLEPNDEKRGDACHSQAGGGDVDGLAFELELPTADATQRRQEQSIWTHLLGASDADTARRLRQDPAFSKRPAMLQLQTDFTGTRGFSVSVDQLLEQGAMWVPQWDMFLRAGSFPVSFAEHEAALTYRAGRRVRDHVRQSPAATLAEFRAKWEDMGNPQYRNPHEVGPGHIVGVTWDSAVSKFGIDRQAGVHSDLGTAARFALAWDFPAAAWQSQRLTNGLPVLSTTWEGGSVRYEVEQFAYPLHGPPTERRGDIPMVLFNRVHVTELGGRARDVSIAIRHRRDCATRAAPQLVSADKPDSWLLVDGPAEHGWLALHAPGSRLALTGTQWTEDAGRRRQLQAIAELLATLAVPAHGSRTVVVKLCSPSLRASDWPTLSGLEFGGARDATLGFWSEYLDRGALFRVPESAVNELFRANLWHALRLPRRHGGEGESVRIDLPYSNFAYGQEGTPWPVNQAVYVDYMLYDLRGYHALSCEELLTIFRNNQEPDGHVGGFANWGVYTPAMVYVTAQHFLLSRDTESFQRLLPSALRAADWCLTQMDDTAQAPDAVRGLMLAPLNDLSHDPQAWAFNQAYLFAGLDRLALALAETGHPRAAEMRSAARRLQGAIARGFGCASLRAPLVQLRDHAWSAYVPSDALRARRLMDVWYPTDVDTGPLHLSRLGALEADDPLTTAMLDDHEDNLFLHGWGMANEPVYNQQGLAYLRRDEPEMAIRTFYSMLACAFSHTVYEPVEHRWGWGQYFGPPSTDGAWFELYRQMLIDERDDGTLVLAQAVPLHWLRHGQEIEIRRAPTWYGPLDLIVRSRAEEGVIEAELTLTGTRLPDVVQLRLRHPAGWPLQSVAVNAQPRSDFDAAGNWVQIRPVDEHRFQVVARFGDRLRSP